MVHPAFENVRRQMGACGIWCGSCAVGNGSLRLASKRIFQTMEGHGIEHWAPPELDYAVLAEGLSIVSDMSSCSGCQKGGGRDSCPMRACTTERQLPDCTQCHETSCSHGDLLDHMRAGALKAGLIVKDSSDRTASVMEHGMKRLATRFPSCLLFVPDEDNTG